MIIAFCAFAAQRRKAAPCISMNRTSNRMWKHKAGTMTVWTLALRCGNTRTRTRGAGLPPLFLALIFLEAALTQAVANAEDSPLIPGQVRYAACPRVHCVVPGTDIVHEDSPDKARDGGSHAHGTPLLTLPYFLPPPAPLGT